MDYIQAKIGTNVRSLESTIERLEFAPGKDGYTLLGSSEIGQVLLKINEIIDWVNIIKRRQR